MTVLVMKFGGASVGTTTALTQVLSIVLQEQERWDHLLLVVSALDGVTDALIEAAQLAQLSNRRGYRRIVATLRTRHIALVEQLIGTAVDAVVAVESRGFIFGAPLASRLNTSFVPARRPGKLPAETIGVQYALEYGQASLELHKDALFPGANVIIIDDLLATGGTAAAARELVFALEANVMAFAFVIELDALGGRKRLESAPVISLIHF